MGEICFAPLLCHPEAEFVDPDHERVLLLDDFDCVADVVTVAVRAKQDVGLLHFLVGLGTHGIAHDPRIDEDCLPGWGFNAERRVAQPREFDPFQIHAAYSS
jgi:hypothetical protein